MRLPLCPGQRSLATLLLACISLVLADCALADCSIRPTGQLDDFGFGLAVALPGDLNEDGYPDFAIGSTTFDAEGSTVPGRVHVFLGGPAVDAIPDLSLVGEGLGDRFGYALEGAGDLNGDGWRDLVVGAYQNDAGGANAGRAYVYFGGAVLDATPDLVLTGFEPGEQLGIAVAGVGDVSGDGHDDLLVGARFNSAGGPQAGHAYLYFGGPGLDATPDIVMASHAAGERLGFTVARGGDLNGDGAGDFLVGAYTNSAAGFETGRAYVYFGGPGVDGTADLVLEGSGVGAHFSDGLAATDANGDGYQDVLVGASQFDGARGRAYLYLGGPGLDATADLVLAEGDPGDWFGRSATGGADLDGDGFGDVVIGSPALGTGGAGRVYVYRGGPALDATADSILAGEALGDRFGWSGAATGSDATGDGAGDLLVGAPTNDTAGPNVGRAYLRFPPCLRLACPPDTTVTPGHPVVRRFCLTSCDGEERTFTYAIADDAGWFGPVAGSVALQPGETACLEIAGVAPTDTCVGATTVAATIGIAGCPEPVAACTSRVRLRLEPPVLRCAPDTVVVAGDTLRLAFCLRNPNAVPLDYAVLVYDYLGWCASTRDTVPLAPGDSKCVEHICVVPAGTPCGVEDGFVFSARAVCGSSSAYCMTDVAVGARVCVTTLCPAAVDVPVGRTAEARLCFRNCDSAAGTFDWSVRDESGWCAPASGSVTVAAGDTACIAVACTAPVGTPCSTQDTVLLVVRSQACPRDSFTCTTQLVASPIVDAVLALAPAGQPDDVAFGVAVALPGDVNDDGYDDFAVGATTTDPEGNTIPGRVHVFFGGPAADDVADLTLSGEVEGDRFGYVLDGAGDLNGDGARDLVVGAYQNDASDPGAGRAYVFFGGAGLDAVPDLVLDGLEPGEQLGIAVAGVGDVSGDGHDDLLVGARFNTAGGPEAGRAYLYFGGPGLDSTPDVVCESHAAGERLGFTVARGGDLNGDGEHDFLVGAYHNATDDYEAGRAYVYFGGPGVDGSADLVLAGSGFRAHFSDALAAADVDGDGHPDVLVGASQVNGAAGRAYVYRGGPVLDATADLVLDPGVPGDWFGRFVAGGADLDGDGWGDLVAGAPGATNGGRGRVYLYRGGPGIDATCDGVLAGAAPEDRFGWHGAANGSDTTGDGSPDLLVGAYGHAVVTVKAAPPETSAADAEIPRVAVPGARGRAYLFTQLRPIPVALEGLAGTVGEDGVVLSWNLSGEAVERLVSVRVERAEAAAGPWYRRATLAPRASMTWEDREVESGRTYWYRLVLVTGEGESSVAGPLRLEMGSAVTRTVLDLVSETGDGVHVRYRIGPTSRHVQLDVYDVAGRRLRTLEAGRREPGAYVRRWDRRDTTGRRVTRGVYIVRLRADGVEATRKLVLVRP